VEVLPDLAGAKFIGLDVETRDPNLKTRGPGGVRGDGEIVGVSLATDLGHSFYLPIGHPRGNQSNLDRSLVVSYLREQLSRSEQVKLGAHVLYDLEWLHCDLGVSVVGPLYDVLVAEPLIDETQRSYNLDSVSKKYLNSGKEYDHLERVVLEFFGEKAAKNPRAYIWQLPPEHAGKYAEADALLPLKIFEEQRKVLEREKLWDVFTLESKLIPMLLAMRLRGVKVDVHKAERIMADLQVRQDKAQRELQEFAGRPVNVWANEDISKVFDAKGAWYPRTPAGNPSFTAEWLEKDNSAVSQRIFNIRKLDRIRSTFIGSVVIKHSVEGRVHCQFHQLKSDEGGTVTGRFSSSNPNLQQVPKRDPDLAPLVRGCFIPEEDCFWACDDFSQIEPRLQVHYAFLRGSPGADRARERYISDPNTDFHQMTADITGLERRPAKTVHLALTYGQGLPALAEKLGVSLEEARGIKNRYNTYAGFIAHITDEVTRMASSRGYIRTLLGRKCTFNEWEPANSRGRPLRSKEEAQREYGAVRRAHCRKSFNKLIQGSAADVMKKAMVDIWESGVCSEIGAPHLTVHDELDWSIPRDRPDIGEELARMMERCVDLEVPLKVDHEVGEDWGTVR
jgi:DNA polymerase I-like protein with 3'-5' exonuclease and polymerase domains